MWKKFQSVLYFRLFVDVFVLKIKKQKGEEKNFNKQPELRPLCFPISISKPLGLDNLVFEGNERENYIYFNYRLI